MKRVAMCVAMLRLVAGFALAPGQSAVPSLMNHQGRLTDANGRPLATAAAPYVVWIAGVQYDVDENIILPDHVDLQGASANDTFVYFNDASLILGETNVRGAL